MHWYGGECCADDNYVYCFSGDYYDNSGSYGPTKEAWKYDPINANWIRITDTPYYALGGSCARVGDKIYIIQAWEDDQYPNYKIAPLIIYDIPTDSYETRDGIDNLSAVTSIAVDDMIYNFGGSYYPVGGYSYNTTAYNVTSEEWIYLANCPEAYLTPGLAVVGKDIYLIGGVIVDGDNFGVTSKIYKYDISADSWELYMDNSYDTQSYGKNL